MGEVADSFARVGTQGGEMTTGFEHQAQSVNAATSQMVNNWGLVGKSFDRARTRANGLVMGMGIAEQAATDATSAWEVAGDKIKAAGVDSFGTLAKLGHMGTLSVQDFTNNVQIMSKELGLNDKSINSVNKAFLATGEVLNDVSGSFKQQNDLLALARRQNSLLAQNIKTVGAEDTIKGVLKGQRLLKVLSGDTKGAMEATMELQSMSTQSMESFRNLFAGKGSDLHKFETSLAITTGSIEEAFSLATKAPDKFIERFSEVAIKMKAKGANMGDFLKLFGGQMEETLGPKMIAMLTNVFNSVDEAKLKAAKAAEGSGRDLTEFAKQGYRSTKTLKDQFDLVMGAGVARFRQLGMQGVQTFMHDLPKAFDTFNASAEAIVKEGGPFGRFVVQLAEAHVLGAKAFLPDVLRPMATIFGQLYEPISASYDVFSDFVSKLFSFKGAVSGAIAGTVMLHGAFAKGRQEFKADGKTKKTNEDIGKELGTSITKGIVGIFKGDGFLSGLRKNLKDLATEIPLILKNINWAEIWDTIKTSANDLWKSLSDVFNSIDWKGIWSTIKSGWGELTAVLKEWWDKIDWDFILKTAKDQFKEAWKAIFGGNAAWVDKAIYAWNEYGPVVTQVLSDVIYYGGQLWDTLSEIYKFTRDYVWPVLKDVWTGIKVAIDIVTTTLSGLWDIFSFGVGIVKTELNEVKTIFDGIKSVMDLVSGSTDKMGSAFEQSGTQSQSALQGIWDKAKSLFGHSINTLVDEDMGKTVKVMEEATGQVKSMVEKGLYDAVVSGVTSAFATAFTKVFKASEDFFKNETAKFSTFATNIDAVFRNMWIGILRTTDEAADAMAKTLAGSLADMERLKTALQQVQSARAAMSATGGGKDAAAPAFKADPAKDLQMQILEQSAMPDWYVKSYQAQFDRGVADIVAAVKANKVQPAGDRSAAAQTATRLGQTPTVGPSPFAGIGALGGKR